MRRGETGVGVGREIFVPAHLLFPSLGYQTRVIGVDERVGERGVGGMVEQGSGSEGKGGRGRGMGLQKRGRIERGLKD